MKDGGFSLVEVMIAAGMMGVVALGAMQMTDRFSKTLSYYEAKIEELELRSQLSFILSDSSACKHTFGGSVIDASGPVNLSVIKTKNNSTQFEVGKKFGGSVRIKTLNITNDSTDGVSATGGFGKAYLNVVTERPKNATGSREYSFSLPVNVATGNGTYPASISEREIYDCGFADIASVLASKTCPAGETLTGFDDSGNPLCTSGLDELYRVQKSATSPGSSSPPDAVKCAFVSHFHDSSDSANSYDTYVCLR